jgi:low affinity Fe/Cu permease
MNEAFRKFAQRTSNVLGTSWVFVLALAVVLVWAVSGPFFQFSTTWQLLINTGTTIMTFLMVFIIQNTQNRDAKAIHLKLDELIESVEDARNELVDIEDASEEELESLEKEYAGFRQRTAAAAGK